MKRWSFFGTYCSFETVDIGVFRMTWSVVLTSQPLRCNRSTNTPVKPMYWEIKVWLLNSAKLVLLLSALGLVVGLCCFFLFKWKFVVSCLLYM